MSQLKSASQTTLFTHLAYVACLTICLLTSTSLFAQNSLTFNTTGQPPLNTEAHNGFMDEVTREALKRIGYTLKINRVPAERGLRYTNNGTLDAEMSRIEGLDKLYPNLIRIPEKIMDWEFVAFSKNPLDLQQGWKSLIDKNIGFINGWKILEKSSPKEAAITKAKNHEQLFSLLIKNRVDLIIYERWAGEYLIKKSNLKDIKIRKPTLIKKELFIYLHKKHIALIPKLTQAISNMKKDGSYDALVKKHLTPLK